MTHLVLLLALTVALAAQSTSTAPARESGNNLASVSGQIVDGDGAGLRRAIVTLVSVNRKAQTLTSSVQALTNSDGRFTFQAPPGDYELTAQKANYFIAGRLQGLRYSVPPLTLHDGEQVTNVVIALKRLGIITGRVVSDGEPISAVSITCLRSLLVRGQRRWSSAGSTTTNDLGDFRLTGLVPGRYLVMAQPPPLMSGNAKVTNRTSWTPAFFQGAASAEQATLIQVEAGSVLSGIDFQLSESKVYNVSGSVAGGEAELVQLVPSLNVEGEQRKFASVAKGHFSFTDVFPGDYTLRASAGKPGRMKYGLAKISVNAEDLTDLKLTPERTVSVLGTVHDLSSKATVQSGPRVMALQPVDGGEYSYSFRSVEPAEVDESGHFRFDDVIPGLYEISSLNPQRGYVQSARLNEHTLENNQLAVGMGGASIDITIANDYGRVVVTALDSKKRKTPGVFVSAVPNATHSAIIRGHFGATSYDGELAVIEIIPGNYRFYVYETNKEINPFEPDWLEQEVKRYQTIVVEPNSVQRITSEFVAPASGSELEKENDKREKETGVK